MAEIPGATVLGSEPCLQLALDADCRTQCRLSVETRTGAYHVRTGDYPEEQLSVYLTTRRYGSLDPGETYVSAMRRLAEICTTGGSYVADSVLRPLQQAIAMAQELADPTEFTSAVTVIRRVVLTDRTSSCRCKLPGAGTAGRTV